MKVSNKVPNPMQNAEGGKVGKLGTDGASEIKKGGRAAALETTAANSAKVDPSERAQQIKKAKELATPNDSVDEAKVARLQKLIDEGKYKVDASAIADKLIDEHAKLPS